MSFRSIQQNTVEKTDTFSVSIKQSASVIGTTAGINQYANGQWFRNPTWPALPSISTSDEKVVGIYAVYPHSPFIAVLATVTTGTYTVDWGDGNVNTYTSGTQANYTYDFNDADLANTNGSVTFTDSGDTVNKTNHGYQNDMPISFESITTTTGITASQIYYVVNATTDTFQIAETVGGTPLALTNDGSGTILPYKIAIVQIYPTNGAAFFQTTLTLNARNTNTTAAYYNGWLDLAISGRFTTLNLAGTTPTFTGYLEQVRILKHRLTSYSSLFNACYKLQSIVEITEDTGISVISCSSMFNNCWKLQSIPVFNTSNVTNMSNMFSSCFSLQTIPLFNTSKVTTMNSMFTNCYSLTSIPLIDTSLVTDMNSMFSGNFILQTIPLLNTSNVTTANSMFSGCRSLQTIPSFNMSAVTSMTSMFFNCSSLQTISSITTSSLTNTTQMFSGCTSLINVSLFNTSNVTVMTQMFQNCLSLRNIPLFNTSKVTNMEAMFSGCASLQTIPLLNTSNVTNTITMFFNCTLLQTIPLINTSNVTNMNSMFDNCQSLYYVPLLNTSNVANVNAMFNACTSLSQIPAFNLAKVAPSGNLTSFSTSLVNLNKISVGNVYYTWSIANNKLSGAALDEIYTNLSTVQAAGTAVTFDGTADTVTLTNHGYANLRTVSFATITTTTGISTGVNYFVRNVTTDTFQLSTSATGSIINLVNNGNGTLNGQTITVTGNWGTATDTPSIATAKGWTVTGS